MKSFVSCVLLAAVALGLPSACVATPEAREVHDAFPILVRAEFPDYSIAPPQPLGWIYAADDAQGRPARCLTIWTDSTWTLAEEAAPGSFDRQLLHRCIGTTRPDGLQPLLDCPRDIFAGFRRVWTAGRIEVLHDGQPVPGAG